MTPLSGSAQAAGQQLLTGVRACFDDQNGIRSISSRFWTFRSFDDQNTLNGALLNSRFAMADPNQAAAIGHLSGNITSQVERYYSGTMPLIVPIATADSVTNQGYPGIFRLTTKDSTEGLLHARFVKAERRGQKIAVVYQEGDYGPDVVTTFIKQTALDGFHPFDVKLAADRADMSATASTIVEQQADLVFMAGLAPVLGPLIPALKSAGWNGRINGSAGFFDGGLWPSYGALVEGLVVSTSMPPLQIVPSALSIKTQYEQTHGPMTPIAAFGYAAAQIFITAVQRFNSTNRLLIARAIAQPFAIDTLTGSFTFDPFGDPQDPNVYFYQLQGGTWHYLRAAHPSSYIVR